jgi:hypothetical protein
MVAIDRSLLRASLGAFFFISIATLTVYQFSASRLGHSELYRLGTIADDRMRSVDAWLIDQRSSLRHQLKDTTILEAGRKVLAAPRRSRLAPPSPAELALDSAFGLTSSLRLSTSLLSNGGIIVYSTNPEVLGYYRPLANTTTLLHPHELETKPYNLYTDGVTRLPAVTLALPLYSAPINDPGSESQSKKRLGVLAANLDLGVLLRRVREDPPPGAVSIMLVGQTGFGTITEIHAERPNSVLSSKARQDGFLPPLSSNAILRAMDGFSGRGAYLDARGIPVLGVYRWIPSLRMALMVESPQSLTFAPARRIARGIFICGNAFVLSVCFLIVRHRRLPIA